MLRQKSYLNPETILKYFISKDEKVDTLIICNRPDSNLVTTDHALYEALGSIKENDNFNWRKLVKFLETVQVISYENVHRKTKPLLTDKRVEELRKKALSKEEIQK